MKHILIITGDAGLSQGKKNTFYHMLAEFSKHWDQVSIIAPSNECGVPFKIHENVHVYPAPHTRKFHYDAFKFKQFVIQKALEINQSFPLSLVTSQFIPPFFLHCRAGEMLAEKLNIPHVIEIHGMRNPNQAKSLSSKLIQSRMDKFLGTQVSKTTHVRMVNNNEMKTYLTNIGFDKSHMHFLPAIYIQTDLFYPRPVAKQPSQFLFVGTLDKNKGIDRIIEAINRVNVKHNVTLKVVGEGPLRVYLEKKVNKLGLDKKVVFVGWVEGKDELAELYSESQALIMASEYEGGPRVTFEAMACGTLVIATKVGLIGELATNMNEIIFTDRSAKSIAEKIKYALNSPEEVNKIAAQGLKFAAQFEAQKVIGNYAQLYLNLIDR